MDGKKRNKTIHAEVWEPIAFEFVSKKWKSKSKCSLHHEQVNKNLSWSPHHCCCFRSSLRTIQHPQPCDMWLSGVTWRIPLPEIGLMSYRLEFPSLKSFIEQNRQEKQRSQPQTSQCSPFITFLSSDLFVNNSVWNVLQRSKRRYSPWVKQQNHTIKVTIMGGWIVSVERPNQSGKWRARDKTCSKHEDQWQWECY